MKLMNLSPNPLTRSAAIFFEPDDAAGGGEGAAPESATYDPWAGSSEPDNEPATGGPEPTPAPASSSTPSPSPAPSGFDSAAFGESFAKTFAQVQQQSAPPAPPTPEQIAEARRQLNYFDVTDEFLTKFDNLETRKASLEAFRDGIVKHIVTVMNHLRENDRETYTKQFDERLTPLQSLIQERQASERQSRFNERFPQFAGLGDHVNAAITHLSAKRAFEGKDEAASFKVLAEFLAGQAKSFNPNFVLEDRANGASASSSRSSNSLPVTGGGSGASRTGSTAPAGKGNWALRHMK